MAKRQVEIGGLRLAKFIAWFIYAVTVLVELLLVTAFLLLLFGASPSAPFTRWVYRATNEVMEPFRGIFGTVEGGTDSILDLSILFAMFIYGIIAIALDAFVKWLDHKIRYFKAKERYEESLARAQTPAYTPPATPPMPAAAPPSVPPSGEGLPPP